MKNLSLFLKNIYLYIKKVLKKTLKNINNIATLFIAIWTVILGQSQFKANLKISEAQLKLARSQNDQILKSEAPILAISTAGFTPIFKEDYYEYLLKLKNYGNRPATNIKINTYLIGFNNEDQLININSFTEDSANPITKEVQWDIPNKFVITTTKKIFIYLVINYSDMNNTISKKDSFLFYIPERKYLKDNIEHQLFNASNKDQNRIEKFIKTNYNN